MSGNEKLSDVIFNKLNSSNNGSPRTTPNTRSTPNKQILLPPSYDNFDSSFRGSLSTLVASDDDLSNLDGHGPVPSSYLNTITSYNYLLNSWSLGGSNFENLLPVFKDIAQLPNNNNSGSNSHNNTLTSHASNKSSEEYVWRRSWTWGQFINSPKLS